MLILTRKRNESIMIGHDVKVTIVSIRGGEVKLGISAPREIAVHREEIYRRILQEGRPLTVRDIFRGWKSVVGSGAKR